MATYPMPKCGLTVGSDVETLDALKLSRTEAGTLRGVSLWPTPKKRYTLVHASCSVAEADALDASYATNRASATVDFTWKESGTTVTARWVSVKRRAIGKFRVSVQSVLETV